MGLSLHVKLPQLLVQRGADSLGHVTMSGSLIGWMGWAPAHFLILTHKNVTIAFTGAL